MRDVGLISPGEMGAAVGSALVTCGHRVHWASEGRSAESATRASTAGLIDAGNTSNVAQRCEVILSICPPAAALSVAQACAGYRGLYVDANAISPMTSRAVAERLEPGASFVDGGIIGPPPRESGSTRLYLSGPHAAEVAALFEGSTMETRVISDRCGDASGLKMAYAAWTKGTSALVIAVRELARSLGLENELRAEWAISQPGLEQRFAAAASSARSKGWRWTAEMREIASTFEEHSLPAGFHEAAAELFEREPRPHSG